LDGGRKVEAVSTLLLIVQGLGLNLWLCSLQQCILSSSVDLNEVEDIISCNEDGAKDDDEDKDAFLMFTS
jgi:hypothetical protein